MPEALKSKLVFLAITFIVVFTVLAHIVVSEHVYGPGIVVVEVTGAIDEGIKEYIATGLKEAERRGWPLIIYLDTPGGYLATALDIVDMMDKADVPVITYAEGRWAVSAGTLILLSAPKAYMARHTIIGSMQPVVVTPEGLKPVNESKVINPILKILEVHCKTFGRNYSIVKLFVIKNLNLDGEEAYRYRVVDGLAESIKELVEKLNGTRFKLYNGKEVILKLKGPILKIPKPLRCRIISFLSDPTLASLLLSLGTFILIVSIASGHIAYASIALLLILLGLMGLGYNVNTLSVLLVILGAILLAIDLAVIPGFGIVGGTGIVMLLLGLMLMPFSTGFYVAKEYAESLMYTAITVGAFLGAFAAFTLYKIVQTRKARPIVSPLPVGKRGRALEEIRPDKEGFIIVEGEYWKAISRKSVIKPGQEVVVVAKDGPRLVVELAEEGSAG